MTDQQRKVAAETLIADLNLVLQAAKGKLAEIEKKDVLHPTPWSISDEGTYVTYVNVFDVNGDKVCCLSKELGHLIVEKVNRPSFNDGVAACICRTRALGYTNVPLDLETVKLKV